MAKLIGIVWLFVLAINGAIAAEAPKANAPVQVNVSTGDLTLEVQGLETTLVTASQSLATLTHSLQKLSEREDLSTEELLLMRDVMSQLSTSTNKIADAANNLPANIKSSQQPIKAIADDLLASVTTTIYIALFGVLLLLAAVLWLVYHYVLKPVKLIALNMERISSSVEKTVATASRLDAPEP